MAASPRAHAALLLLLTAAWLQPCRCSDAFYDYVDDSSASSPHTNTPPEFVNPVHILNATAGEVFKFRLPEDTCQDAEDGGASHLRLRLLLRYFLGGYPGDLNQIFKLGVNSTEIYGLPLPRDLGGHEYFLECRDADDNRVRRPLHVWVLPSPTPLPPPAVFSLSVSAEYQSFRQGQSFRVELIEMIAKVFGDPSPKMMSVLDIDHVEGGTRVSWYNSSLRAAPSCPITSILRLRDVLASSDGVSPSLHRHFSPAFNVTHVTVTLSPHCLSGNATLAAYLPRRMIGTAPGNPPPLFRLPLEVISATAGAVFTLRLPPGTCTDAEGGNHTSLYLRSWDSGSLTSAWLRFYDGRFYGVPLPEDVGEESFVLNCEDRRSGQAWAVQKVVVRPAVLPHPAPALFSLTLATSELDLRRNADSLILLLEELANALYDDTPELISISSIGPAAHGGTVVTWYNSSLRAAPRCPVASIRRLHDYFLSPEGVSPALTNHFLRDFDVTDASVTLSRHCLLEQPWVVLAGMPIASANAPPKFLNHINSLEVEIGSVFKFQIPTDTCYDAEDGDASHLHFRLLNSQKKEVPRHSWLQVNASSREIYGFSLGDHRHEDSFFLECRDSAGSRVIDALKAVPRPRYRVPRPAPAVFTLSVNVSHRTIDRDTSSKVSLIEKIASAYGDSSPRLVSVSSIKAAAHNSTLITWFNSSLRASPPCPVASILRLHDVLASAEGVSPSLRRHFSPAFNVTRASVVLTPHCLAGKPWAAGDALLDLRDPFGIRTGTSLEK